MVCQLACQLLVFLPLLLLLLLLTMCTCMCCCVDQHATPLKYQSSLSCVDEYG